MKRFLKPLTAIVAVLAIFVLGCSNPAGDDPYVPPSQGYTPDSTVEAMADYYDGAAINLTIPAGGNSVTGARLTTLTGVQGVSPYTLAGTMSYTAADGDNPPFITYTLKTSVSGTLDTSFHYYFDEDGADYVAKAIQARLGVLTNSYPADRDAGYNYFGAVSAAVIESEAPVDDGHLVVKILLAKDAAAEDLKGSIGTVTGVTIDGPADITLAPSNVLPGDAAVTYNGSSKKLSLAFSAPGITESGALWLKEKLFADIQGKVTNNVDDCYRVISVDYAITGNGVTVYIQLQGKSTAQAGTIAGGIPTPTGSNAALTVAAGGTVTGTPVTSLQNIADGTGTPAVTSYDDNTHTITITVPPRADFEYSTEPGFYSETAGKFNNLISSGTVTNNYAGESFYIGIGAASVEVAGGNLVFTIPLFSAVPAATLNTAISGAANGNLTVDDPVTVTGALVTALDNIAGGLEDIVTVYNSATHAIVLTLDPPAEAPFNSQPGFYSAAATALNTKIGANVTNDVEEDFYTANGVSAVVNSAGKLVLTVNLRLAYVAATTITTNASVTGVTASTALTIDGDGVVAHPIIGALTNITNGTGNVTAVYDSAAHRIIITVARPANLLFNPTASTYSTVTTAVQGKINAAITNGKDPAWTTRGTVTLAGTSASLTFTIPITAATIPAAPIITAINDVLDNGTTTITGNTSVTSPYLNALVNISNTTRTLTTSYNFTNHQLSISVLPAAGLAFGTAATYNDARTALVTKIQSGTFVNSLEPTYTTISGTPAVAITAGNLVITITLTQVLPVIPAAALYDAIDGAADGNITVASTGVTGAAISALRNIQNATGNVGTGYTPGNHTITLTVIPATGYAFSTAGNFYTTAAADSKNIAALLNTNLATITNNVESGYFQLNAAPTVAVTSGNLVISIVLKGQFVTAANLASAVTAAGDGDLTVVNAASVTGSLVTALTNVDNATGAVVAGYNASSHEISLTIAPAALYSFNTASGTYTTGAGGDNLITLLTTALTGGTIVNNAELAYSAGYGAPVVSVVGVNLVVTIPLQPYYVDATVIASEVSDAADGSLAVAGAGVTGALVTALGGIANATGTVTPAYSDHQIVFTVAPATGYIFNTTASTYSGVATALNTKLGTGAITNSIDAGYTVMSGTPAAAVTGGNLVLTITLRQPYVDAEDLADAITGAANGNLTVAESGVTGAVITELGGISNATGTVTVVYNASHQIVLTVSPAAGVTFNTASNAYTTGADVNNVSTVLNTKLGTITNSVDAGYTVINAAPTVAVTSGNLVITITLRLPYVDPSVLESAVTSAVDGNLTVASAGITGAVVTALGNISGSTGTVTPAYVQANHRITLTIVPVAGKAFESTASVYSGLVSALTGKLAITNSVEAGYTQVNGAITAAVTSGNLVLTINLRLPYVAVGDIKAAIEGTGTAITVTPTNSVTGTFVTGLSGVSNTTGTIATTAYSTTNRRITLTIPPASGFAFDTTIANYTTNAGGDNILTALSVKLADVLITNNATNNATYTAISATVPTAAITSGNLVLTITLAVNNITAAEIAGLINGAADSNLSVALDNSVTGALVTALTNVQGITGNVTVAYTTGNKRITFTISPATGRAFNATANYTTSAGGNNVSTVLNTKLSGSVITNAVDPTYTVKTSAAPTVTATTTGTTSLAIYFVVGQDFVTASDLADAITGAGSGDLEIESPSSVTGDIITALTNIPGVIETVTTSYSSEDHTITLTVSPVSTKAFNTTASTYSSVADALAGKLGGITNDVDAGYTTAGTPSAAVTGGNLNIDIVLEE